MNYRTFQTHYSLTYLDRGCSPDGQWSHLAHFSPVWPPWPHHWWVTWWGGQTWGTDVGWPWPVWISETPPERWVRHAVPAAAVGTAEVSSGCLLGARLQPATPMCSRDAGACAGLQPVHSAPETARHPALQLPGWDGCCEWRLWIHAVPAPSDSRGNCASTQQNMPNDLAVWYEKPCCT